MSNWLRQQTIGAWRHAHSPPEPRGSRILAGQDDRARLSALSAWFAMEKMAAAVSRARMISNRFHTFQL
ncbi:hypothetical protein [Azospirillum sp. BE72]|uniref:hypothetical protein n=1 Tax=Azospirillum sp. BE72 TaxID=2817776 RepID=UPI0028629046|nr:hypothetical protein [Azospirillum sp. BE72]MDR6773538.1 hypothetical protein [Azospirillum sp. BE72]